MGRPEIKKYNILYEIGYYDGILGGVLECNGQQYYFVWEQDDADKHRIYHIYDITDKEMGHLDFRNYLFEFCYKGTYSIEIMLFLTALFKSQEKYFIEPVLRDDNIIGWFKE